MNSKWVKSESVIDSTEIDDNNNNNHQMFSLPKPGGPLKPRLDAVKKRYRYRSIGLKNSVA